MYSFCVREELATCECGIVWTDCAHQKAVPLNVISRNNKVIRVGQFCEIKDSLVLYDEWIREIRLSIKENEEKVMKCTPKEELKRWLLLET
jgi:hypothetical protein